MSGDTKERGGRNFSNLRILQDKTGDNVMEAGKGEDRAKLEKLHINAKGMGKVGKHRRRIIESSPQGQQKKKRQVKHMTMRWDFLTL